MHFIWYWVRAHVFSVGSYHAANLPQGSDLRSISLFCSHQMVFFINGEVNLELIQIRVKGSTLLLRCLFWVPTVCFFAFTQLNGFYCLVLWCCVLWEDSQLLKIERRIWWFFNSSRNHIYCGHKMWIVIPLLSTIPFLSNLVISSEAGNFHMFTAGRYPYRKLLPHRL